MFFKVLGFNVGLRTVAIHWTQEYDQDEGLHED